MNHCPSGQAASAIISALYLHRRECALAETVKLTAMVKAAG